MYELICNGRHFLASLEHNEYDNMSTFTVAPSSRARPIPEGGCVIVRYATKYIDHMHTDADLQWFTFDAKCTRKSSAPLDRNVGTKTMLVGALQAMKSYVLPDHVTTLALDDCSQFNGPHTAPIMLISLLTSGKTYYQKVLNVVPDSERGRKRLNDISTRICSRMDVTFDLFMQDMCRLETSQSEYDVDCTWIREYELEFKMHYVVSRSWQSFFSRIRRSHGIDFFVAHSINLLKFFSIDKLECVEWVVDFEKIPKTVDGKYITNSLSDIGQVGGGSVMKRIQTQSRDLQNRRHQYMKRTLRPRM